MVKCPNCGQDTESDPCQWCNHHISKDNPENKRKSYPIILGRPLKRGKTGGQTKKKTEESKEAKKLAKEQAKKEKEKAKKAKQLAKERAKKQTEEAKKAEQLEKEQAEKKAEETTPETKAPVENEQVEAEKAQAAAEEAPELYEGVTELIFPSPVNLEQIRKFEEQLKKIKEISLLWSGGSEEGAAIAIKTPKPMPLIAFLQKMPVVEEAAKGGKDKKITVTLKD